MTGSFYHKSTALIFVIIVSIASNTNAFAERIPPSVCSESAAISATEIIDIVSEFCSREVNGKAKGCHFTARGPSPLKADEIADTELAWIINASIIHSFDEEGQPIFMPEGTMFIRLSQECKVKGLLQHGGYLPFPDLCENEGGHWLPDGKQCNYSMTADGGAPCKAHSECESACVAELTDEQERLLVEEFGKHRFEFEGKCSANKPGPSCMPSITDDGLVDAIICE